jgi:hypothetical protein
VADMDFSDCLDVMILGTGKSDSAIGYARHNSDVFISEIPGGKNLQALLDFTERIRKAVAPGTPGRPSESELNAFGNDLFDFCFANELRDVYKALPSSHIRLQFLTCHNEMKSVPWEFMQEPKKTPGPRRVRSIVRIVPSFGKDVLSPKPRGQKIKVLLVASYPINQDRVSWDDISRRIGRSLQPFTEFIVLEKCVPGTWADFTKALRIFQPDVVHFSGHGSAGKKETQLLFMKPDTNDTEAKGAADIVPALRDRGIRLVVLSACETSTRPRALQEEFLVLAETLVNEGISAVVANQLPVRDDTVAAFVGPLYQKLFETGDIDLAVAEGRQNYFSALQNDSPAANLEWGIPTLHRHIAGAKILEVQQP